MTQATPLQLALNDALSERTRLALRPIDSMFSGADHKRPQAWLEYGYPENPTFDDYIRLYERHGIAHGAINTLVEKCWETDPWVIEGEEKDDKAPDTAWEKDLKRVFREARIWSTLRQGDVRRLVGQFSGLLLQLRDGKKWDLPVTGGTVGLVKLIPAWQSSLTVDTWDEDVTSATYGEALVWNFNEGGTGGRQLKVHRDRILILGDYRDGVPFLRAGFNSFVDLEKIQGGSGEGFLKNAARQLHVGFEKDVNLQAIAQAYGVPVGELQSLFDQVTRDVNQGVDATVITQGASVSALTVAVPDPSPHYSIALQTACASVRIPSRIVVGAQQGDTASKLDIEAFNSRGQGRRETVLTLDIENLVRKLMAVKVLKPIERFTVMFDDLRAASQSDKLDAALKMADIVQKLAGSGDVAPFTSADIRDTAGLQALDPEELEPLPDVDDADEVVE